jgi:hypothetical protein
MKRLFTLLMTFAFTIGAFSQTPEKMSYQAVVRNSGGGLVTDQSVGVRISILQGSPTGALIWTETCSPNPQTNSNGLVTLEIGKSNPLSFDLSSGGPYFLKTETDPTGGTDYTIVGTSQLLSVPYALYSKRAASYSETDPVFVAWDKSSGISIPSSQVTNFQTSVTNNSTVLANTAKISYPAADASKLAGIEAGAEVNVNADWNASSGDAQILNKPTISAGTNPGDMQYWNGTSWVLLPVGLPGQFLKVSASNIPVWSGETAVISTSAASSISETSATCGGNITSDGGISITARGVCWSTSANPTIANSKTIDGVGSGSFTSSITGLITGSTYHVRAYATNSVGTSYGNEVIFKAIAIGTNFQGGVIAYILQPGDPGYDVNVQHGLIAATSDQGSAPWGCEGTPITGADGTALGTGNQNTIEIIAGCSTPGTAAKLCSELDLNGYTDWYLPSIDELTQLYLNQATIGGFDTGVHYWSSSETNNNWAKVIYFSAATIGDGFKNTAYYVRAIRSF